MVVPRMETLPRVPDTHGDNVDEKLFSDLYIRTSWFDASIALDQIEKVSGDTVFICIIFNESILAEHDVTSCRVFVDQALSPSDSYATIYLTTTTKAYDTNACIQFLSPVTSTEMVVEKFHKVNFTLIESTKIKQLLLTSVPQP